LQLSSPSLVRTGHLQVCRWASAVLGFSSELTEGHGHGSAANALGAPDVYPQVGSMFCDGYLCGICYSVTHSKSRKHLGRTWFCASLRGLPQSTVRFLALLTRELLQHTNHDDAWTTENGALEFLEVSLIGFPVHLVWLSC